MTAGAHRTRPGWPGLGLLALVMLALVLTGCFGSRSSRSPAYSAYNSGATPPDPPPLPRLKPTPPAGFTARAPAPAQPPVQAQPQAPAKAQREVQAAIKSAAPAPAVPAASTQARSHRVQPGDTVYGVARRYGIRPRALLEANQIGPPYQLRVGQRLRIPAVPAVAVAAPVPAEAAPAVTPGQAAVQVAGQAEAPAVPKPTPKPSPASHQVAKGETVYAIAQRYRVDMAELVRLNGIDGGYRISPGQKLLLPGADKGTAIARADGAVPPPVVQGPLPKPPPRTADKFLWPLAGKTLISYGPKKDGLHNDGINIAGPKGAPIRAAENGVVAYAGNELRGFGNLLLIKHADGWITAYAHTDKILVGRGQRVQRGQVVAQVGDSGNVAQPQLHFEIRKGTRAVNPTKLLGGRQSAQAY